MDFLSTREWVIATHLYRVTRDTEEEKMLDAIAREKLPGFDRHSYGIVMATPEQIRNYGFMNKDRFPEDYGANIVGEKGIPIYTSNISEIMRKIRTKEGVSLLEVSDDPKILRNGMLLPSASPQSILSELRMDSIDELVDKLSLGEEIGGKIRALLAMGVSHPDIALLRLNGTNYLFKGAKKYDLETEEIINLSNDDYQQLKQSA